MEKTTITPIPVEKELKKFASSFHLCINHYCIMRSECLHHISFETNILDGEKSILSIINPAVQDVTESGCSYFKSAVIARYAYGFTNLLRILPPYIFDIVRPKLYSFFGEKPYYNKRKGKSPISPSEQAYIIETLTNAGFILPKDADYFDSYSEGYIVG